MRDGVSGVASLYSTSDVRSLKVRAMARGHTLVEGPVDPFHLVTASSVALLASLAGWRAARAAAD